MGYTGSSKLSLLNALIDEEIIVAYNAIQASTSVVIKISWSKSDDLVEAYAAEIQFVKPKEQTTEFKIYADDIRNRLEGEQLGVRSRGETSIKDVNTKGEYNKEAKDNTAVYANGYNIGNSGRSNLGEVYYDPKDEYISVKAYLLKRLCFGLRLGGLFLYSTA